MLRSQIRQKLGGAFFPFLGFMSCCLSKFEKPLDCLFGFAELGSNSTALS